MTVRSTEDVRERPSREVGQRERLARKSTYDYVVVGGGPNGLGIAAYLSKWGFSVCILDARPEIGGGAENTEPIPGYSIDPHAVFFYAGAAPAPEQLELGRYRRRLTPLTDGISIRPDGVSTVPRRTQRGMFDGADLDDPEGFLTGLGASSETAKFFIELMTNLGPRLTQ